MQSSSAVVCRALVMLACLVAIPLAAVLGKSLPDMVKRVLGGRWPVQTASGGPSQEAPRFEPATAASTAPPGPITAAWDAEPLRPAESPLAAPVEPSLPAVVPAGYESSVGSMPTAAVFDRPSRAVSAVEPDPLRPAPPAVDQFGYIQERLRELGATYYLLESWGNERQLYRFYCRVAVAGDRTYEHYFEATDGDRLRAMAQVLRQVEAWRAGRR